MSFDAVHSVVKKVAQYMADVLEDSRDKVQENLLANGGKNHWYLWHEVGSYTVAALVAFIFVFHAVF